MSMWGETLRKISFVTWFEMRKKRLSSCMKKAIIFDNDGVLVNSEPLYFQATKEMCTQLGKDLSLEEFINCHIKSSRGTWHLLNIPEEEYTQWRKWRTDRYSDLLQGTDLTCEGVPEVIEELSKSYRLCIVTSSKKAHFDLIHEKSDYLKHFEFVITLEDVSESKPSPEPYLKALERLELDADECVVIEDSFRGLQSAIAADVECLIVKNEFSHFLDFTGAKNVVESVSAIKENI